MRLRTAGRRPRASRAMPSRPSPRGAFRVTALAVVLVAAGVTAGSAPAVSQASEQSVTLRLGYDCAFHSGTTPVSALVTATYPAAATVGRPIQPTGTRIAVTLPPAAVANLGRLHATAATLTAGLGTEVNEGTKSSAADWQDFRSRVTAIRRNGPLTLAASGAAPTVTPAAAGKVTVSAADMLLVFTAAQGTSSPPDSTPAASSPATSNQRSSSRAAPAGVQAVCALRAGQDTTLAQIVVSGHATARAHASPAANPAKCLPFPKNLKLNPRFPLPKPLPGSSVTHAAENGCSYAAGFTNSRKLNEAILVGPGLTDLNLGYTTFTKFPHAYSYFYQQVPGQLEYHGRPQLPPARATLLAFGFMPVSATLQISEIGPLNAALVSCLPASKKFKCPPQAPNEAFFFGRVTLRIYDVNINGVPLNVGSHCQTATPFNLELTGRPPAYNISLINGVLTGSVTVPQFSGCANGSDNLDPVFDATVSGPGNFVKINQAPFCTPLTGGGCPPVIPKPKH